MTWNAEETLKLVKIVKQLLCSLANRPQNTEGKDCGTPDAAMYRLHICCTTRPNCSFAIREMRNFSTAECRKAIRGNLWNVPHSIFRKLPLNNFRTSAFRKIPAPTGKSEDSEYQLETAVATNTGRRTCSPLATNTGRQFLLI